MTVNQILQHQIFNNSTDAPPETVTVTETAEIDALRLAQEKENQEATAATGFSFGEGGRSRKGWRPPPKNKHFYKLSFSRFMSTLIL